jgi:hypothetical protein
MTTKNIKTASAVDTARTLINHPVLSLVADSGLEFHDLEMAAKTLVATHQSRESAQEKLYTVLAEEGIGHASVFDEAITRTKAPESIARARTAAIEFRETDESFKRARKDLEAQAMLALEDERVLALISESITRLSDTASTRLTEFVADVDLLASTLRTARLSRNVRERLRGVDIPKHLHQATLVGAAQADLAYLSQRVRTHLGGGA